MKQTSDNQKTLISKTISNGLLSLISKMSSNNIANEQIQKSSEKEIDFSSKENCYSNLHNRRLKTRPKEIVTSNEITRLDEKIQSIVNKNKEIKAMLRQSEPGQIKTKYIDTQFSQDQLDTKDLTPFSSYFKQQIPNKNNHKYNTLDDIEKRIERMEQIIFEQNQLIQNQPSNNQEIIRLRQRQNQLIEALKQKDEQIDYLFDQNQQLQKKLIENNQFNLDIPRQINMQSYCQGDQQSTDLIDLKKGQYIVFQ